MSKDNGRRFAVSSRTGVHIGLWSNGKIAAEVAAENPGNTIEEYLRAGHVDAMLKAEREKALREAASLSWLCFHRCDVEVDVVTAEDILALISEVATKEPSSNP